MKIKNKKPTIGVDIDEVLLDLVTPLTEFHNERYGTTFSRKDFKTYNLGDTWLCSKEEAYGKIYEFFHSPYFEQIKPFRKSQKVVDFLSKNNELIIITSRPDYIQNKTEKWIERNYPNNFSRMHFTHEWSKNGNTRKKDICLSEGVNVLIEDNLDKALGCASTSIDVLLFDCPWNQKQDLPKEITRIYNWGEILDILG